MLAVFISSSSDVFWWLESIFKAVEDNKFLVSLGKNSMLQCVVVHKEEAGPILLLLLAPLWLFNKTKMIMHISVEASGKSCYSSKFKMEDKRK